MREDEVIHAIPSFPKGSAVGPGSLCPQHLVNLTSATADRGGKKTAPGTYIFLQSCFGRDSSICSAVFFGSTLIPLQKKDGGICPIAVGLSLRRLVAKCVSLHFIHSVGADLAPHRPTFKMFAYDSLIEYVETF